jgi:type I site-specific restriction endonuclease
MEYFAPAVQLGLTATPKRTENADTYRYFGEPVYTYSLKDGINDGFLPPFKVKQIQTTPQSLPFKGVNNPPQRIGCFENSPCAALPPTCCI